MRNTSKDQLTEHAEEVTTNLEVARGKGADIIRQARSDLISTFRIEESIKFRSADLDEILVTHLTDGNLDLKMIFPGIVCVKQPGISGMCAQDGMDPSNCTAQCPNFLALPRGQEYIRGTLSYLLDSFDDAKGPTDELRRTWLIEQIRRFLGVYPDVDQSFSERATIQRIGLEDVT